MRLTEAFGPAFYDLYADFVADTYDEIWCKGGRGSLKSSFVSLAVVLGIVKNKGAHALVTRRYDNELRDTVFGQYRWAATKLEVDHLFRFMVSPMQAIYTPTGQMILFKGADNPLKLKSIQLGFGYIKYLHVEECDQFGNYDDIRNLIQSIFRGENHKRTAFYSYNPPKSMRSWVNKETRIEKKGRRVHESCYLDVNPEWLGERFIADAEHLKTVNETAYRHEYLGEEVGTGLEIFNNLDIRAITDEEIKTFDRIRQGLDFGYAIDPACFLRMHYDAKKRRLYIFREEAGIGLSNRVLASKLSNEEKRETTRADSAEPKSIDEMKLDYGLRIQGVKKGAGSVENGVNWLADLENIIIDPIRCPLAAKEFVNYALEINRAGDVVSKYPDKDNHAIDSARYACEDLIGTRVIRAGTAAGALGL
jgi:PBSX family phage terminase large subunit